MEDYFPIGKVTFQRRAVRLREGIGVELDLLGESSQDVTVQWLIIMVIRVVGPLPNGLSI